MFVSDEDSNCVTRWTPGGTPAVVAGRKEAPHTSTDADRLRSPRDLHAFDDGTLFVAEYNGHRVMRWAAGAAAGVVVARRWES